jgi:hypothetical protein
MARAGLTENMARAGQASWTCPLRQLQETHQCFRIYRPSSMPRSGLRNCDRRHRFTLWVPHHFLDAT